MQNATYEEIKNSGRIHFIGIGGISMSTLAMIAQKHGCKVIGSDRIKTPVTERLERAGIDVYYCHDAENIKGAQAIVYTWAIPEDNPELAAARTAGIPCIARCDYLGGIMKEYDVRIGVSGTHGKSTTTAMIAHVFSEAGVDPTVACGAEIPEFEGAYRMGNGEHFIYESCEYRDSFLSFFPSVAVILNIDLDHVDYFHSMDQLIESFKRSAADAGAIVANWDDKYVRRVAEGYEGWFVKVGINSPDVDYSATDISFGRGFASFNIMRESEKLCQVKLRIPGSHNIYDALCAAAASHICGIDPEVIGRALSSFTGTKRRFEFKGSFNGVDVYDDYAHHPTEVAATLSGALQMGYDRVWCVFQPHTYTRAAELSDGFAKALSAADKVILADIYAAREKNTRGVSSADIAKKIDGALYIGGFSEIYDYLKENTQSGDMVLTMGAGDIFKVADALTGKMPGLKQ